MESCEDKTRGELMVIAAKLIMGVDITEIYSPESGEGGKSHGFQGRSVV